ncbi:hypothetical protein L6V77_25945 [Myxococcota bacterium]|nr:hypothetical protein [Myxococcota bacterium]
MRVALCLGLLTPGAARAAAGPMPDFAPIGSVVAHARLAELAPAVDHALRRALGPHYVVDRTDPCGREPGVACDRWPSDGMMLWVRDYAPVVVEEADGRYSLLTYLSPNPNRSLYPTQAARRASHPIRELVDLGRARLAPLPILHENGNFVTDGRRVYTTDLLLERNRTPNRGFDPTGTGFAPRTSDTLLRLVGDALHRRPDEIVVLPSMPGDQSRHVDMYLMALDADTLLVPHIRAEAVRLAAEGAERTLALRAAAFLDGIAATLQGRGQLVERLPMVGPAFIPGRAPGGGPQPVYDSPTNALLLATERSRQVLLPAVAAHRFGPRSPAFERLLRSYERDWVAFFKRRGYEAQLVDTGGLFERSGLIRCATAVFPPARPLPTARPHANSSTTHAQNGVVPPPGRVRSR